jgi:uncharacterized membrane protein (UPF0127 family)
MQVRIVNETRGTELAAAAEWAATPFRRMRGLLGRSGLPEGSGIVLTPCNSVHMFFMRFAIDAVFVDREGTVVKAVESLRPYRVAGARGSRSCVELPTGTIARTGTRRGDRLAFHGPA